MAAKLSEKLDCVSDWIVPAVSFMAKCSMTQQRLCVYRGEESRKCVLLYNKIASALVEYQYLFHKGWLQAMPSVIDALCVSLTYNDMTWQREMWLTGYICLYSPTHTSNLEYRLVFPCPACENKFMKIWSQVLPKESACFFHLWYFKMLKIISMLQNSVLMTMLIHKCNSCSTCYFN